MMRQSVIVFLWICWWSIDASLPNRRTGATATDGLNETHSLTTTINPSLATTTAPTADTYPSIDPTELPTNAHSLRPVALQKIPPLTIAPEDSENILSVTVHIRSFIPDVIIYYTLDGTIPTRASAIKTSANAPIALTTIGEVIVKCFAVKDGMQDSDIAVKVYTIIDRCKPPSLHPNGGTYEGTSTVELDTETTGASICYNIDAEDDPEAGIIPNTDGSMRNRDGSGIGSSTTCVLSGDTLQILTPGQHTLRAVAVRSGMASSPVVSAVFTILAQVAAPIILPELDEFPVSALLTFSCATPAATIYFTTDGTVPTQSSLSVTNGGTIVIDTVGVTVVKAFATEPSMLQSEVVAKTVTVLARLMAPQLLPAPGVYTGDLRLQFHCPDIVAPSEQQQQGVVYYTTDGISTPVAPSNKPIVRSNATTQPSSSTSVSATSSSSGSGSGSTRSIACEGFIQLPSPGVRDVRAIVASPGKSPSSVTEGRYELRRRPYDELPVATTAAEDNSNSNNSSSSSSSSSNGGGGGAGVEEDTSMMGFTVPPLVDIRVVDKELMDGTAGRGAACPKRNVRGRLVVLRNAIDHFDVLPPLQGCDAGRLELPSVSGRAFTPKPGVDISDFVTASYSEINREQPSLVYTKATASEPPPVPAEEEVTGVAVAAADNAEDSSLLTVRHLRATHGISPTTAATATSNIAETAIAISNGATVEGIETGEDASVLPLDRISLSLDYAAAAAASVKIPSAVRDLFKRNGGGISAAYLKTWQEQYEASIGLGCQVVTNAGFFNVSSKQCIGDVISGGIVHQLSSTHNVNFGIRNGSFVVGYVTEEEVLDSTAAPFDMLVSGLGWLVREGESYVRESFSRTGDAEDTGGQTTGAGSSAFLSVRSARTALGHDREGRLMILQVEGETWVRGMSLYEFADFAVEVGMYSAINLDGGGSATMTQNHSLISEPSWKCPDPPLSALDYLRCEKRVASITCVHAAAPPRVDLDRVLRDSLADGPPPPPPPDAAGAPGAAPSPHPAPAPAPAPLPSHIPATTDTDTSSAPLATARSTVPSLASTAIPSSSSSIDSSGDTTGSSGCDPVAAYLPSGNMTSADLQLMSSLYFYETSSVTLCLALIVSLALNVYLYVSFSAKQGHAGSGRNSRRLTVAAHGTGTVVGGQDEQVEEEEGHSYESQHAWRQIDDEEQLQYNLSNSSSHRSASAYSARDGQQQVQGIELTGAAAAESANATSSVAGSSRHSHERYPIDREGDRSFGESHAEGHSQQGKLTTSRTPPVAAAAVEKYSIDSFQAAGGGDDDPNFYSDGEEEEEEEDDDEECNDRSGLLDKQERQQRSSGGGNSTSRSGRASAAAVRTSTPTSATTTTSKRGRVSAAASDNDDDKSYNDGMTSAGQSNNRQSLPSSPSSPPPSSIHRTVTANNSGGGTGSSSRTSLQRAKRNKK